MPEKIGYGEDRNKTIIRTPRPSVRLVRWDWTKGREKDSLDITVLVASMQWQKSIKTPNAGATITCVPQLGRMHLLDYLNPMDVVQIYEFGTLKFQGFIRSIQSTGSIDPKSGKPMRMVSIKVFSFGNLFIDGQLGLNLYIGLRQYGIGAQMEAFAKKLADAVKLDGSTYADVIGAIVDEWFIYLENLGATEYATYLNRFVDYSTGLKGKSTPGYPREVKLFQVQSNSQSLWSIIQKVCEPPFSEVWFDTGPRSVYIEKDEDLDGRPDTIDLPASEGNEKTYMVVRSTPFNGTVKNGVTKSQWDSLPSLKIPLGYLTKFALNKTMDEAFSFYMVQPASIDMSELQLAATGSSAFDTAAFDKYLYRPMVKQQFFSRNFDETGEGKDNAASSILQVATDAANTLKNWNELNDQYLSGSFDLMVPSNEAFDPRIGQKIEFEGLEGNYFYCEGVAHQWQYGGPLTSTISVTRGYGIDKPIELKDKIFRRGIFAMNRQFDE
jgi:hypothetical protein